MSRFLIGNFAVETRNARLNGSNADLEKKFGDETKNTSYTKKISTGNKDYPYASVQQVKFNIKRYLKEVGHQVSKVTFIKTTEASSECHPFKNTDEDVLGFMTAAKVELTEEEYQQLSEVEKVGFKKGGRTYSKNITKKRKSRLMMSPLQAIQPCKITREFATRQTNKTPILYEKEVYSTIMSAGFNLNISQVGVFTVDEDASGFRDYAPEEAVLLGIENGTFMLDKEIRLQRIVDTIRSIEFYNSTACQNNNLEDLTSKFIILSEYRIGNNIFNNIFRNGQLNLDYLEEAIQENEEFRLSPIFIGVRAGFMEELKEQLEERFGGEDPIHIFPVKEAFDSYIEYVTNNLE